MVGCAMECVAFYSIFTNQYCFLNKVNFSLKWRWVFGVVPFFIATYTLCEHNCYCYFMGNKFQEKATPGGVHDPPLHHDGPYFLLINTFFREATITHVVHWIAKVIWIAGQFHMGKFYCTRKTHTQLYTEFLCYFTFPLCIIDHFQSGITVTFCGTVCFSYFSECDGILRSN